MFFQLTSIGSEFGGNDCVTEQLIRIVTAIIEGITPGTIEHLIKIFPKTPHIQPPPSPHPQNNNPQTPPFCYTVQPDLYRVLILVGL